MITKVTENNIAFGNISKIFFDSFFVFATVVVVVVVVVVVTIVVAVVVIFLPPPPLDAARRSWFNQNSLPLFSALSRNSFEQLRGRSMALQDWDDTVTTRLNKVKASCLTLPKILCSMTVTHMLTLLPPSTNSFRDKVAHSI